MMDISKTFSVDVHFVEKIILRESTRAGVKALAEINGHTVVCPQFTENLLIAYEEFENSVVPLGVVMDKRRDTVPFSHYPRLYFLFNDEELVYIGQSYGVASRVATHLKDKVFNYVTTFDIDRKLLTNTEDANIRYHQPVKNLTCLNDGELFVRLVRSAILR